MKKLPILAGYLVMCVILFLPLAFVIRSNTDKILKYSETEIASSALDNLKSVATLNETILQNIEKETANFAKNGTLRGVAQVGTMNALGNTGNFSKLRTVEGQMDQMIYANSSLSSIVLYLDGADYVISSGEGVLPLSTLPADSPVAEYRRGSSLTAGRWVPRKTAGKERTEGRISYVYPLTSITADARGVMVVDLSEERFAGILNTPASGTVNASATFLLDKEGNVVVHGGTNRFLQNLSADRSVAAVLRSSEKDGSFTSSDGEGKTLYVYAKDSSRGWTYISCYSFSVLMQKINEIDRTSFLILVAATVFSVLAALFFLLRMSRPLTAAAKMLRGRKDLSLGNAKNEMLLVSTAFRQLARQQTELNELLSRKEEDSRALFVMDLLKGSTVRRGGGAAEVQDVFPCPDFMVLLVSIDRYEELASRFTPGQREYFRVALLARYREVFGGAFTVRGVLYEDQTVALILNMACYDCRETPGTIRRFSVRLQKEMESEYGLSVSAAVGGVHEGAEGIRASLLEADEALKQRILTGYGSLNFWEERSAAKSGYFYPYEREKRIMNFIRAQNLESVRGEVLLMTEEIRNTPGISYENILQIYNQLVGTAIRFLVENSVNIRSVFGNIFSVYREISALDTLDGMERYLGGFYEKIIGCLCGRDSGGEPARYIDRIAAYIRLHYKSEICFDEMAKSVGISYSYMRKIVRDETGKSLIDYVNSLRVREAKELLAETDESLQEISKAVGYNNVQSFSRFFKKFEGITPGDYRNLQKQP